MQHNGRQQQLQRGVDSCRAANVQTGVYWSALVEGFFFFSHNTHLLQKRRNRNLDSAIFLQEIATKVHLYCIDMRKNIEKNWHLPRQQIQYSAPNKLANNLIKKSKKKRTETHPFAKVILHILRVLVMSQQVHSCLWLGGLTGTRWGEIARIQQDLGFDWSAEWAGRQPRGDGFKRVHTGTLHKKKTLFVWVIVLTMLWWATLQQVWTCSFFFYFLIGLQALKSFNKHTINDSFEQYNLF